MNYSLGYFVSFFSQIDVFALLELGGFGWINRTLNKLWAISVRNSEQLNPQSM